MRKSVLVCGLAHDMTIADGGVMFSDRSGIGQARHVVFTVKSNMWYLLSFKGWFDSVPLCHLVCMQELLNKYIGEDHSVLELKFKPE